MQVFGVSGWKNNGNTSLMERLVAENYGRGFSVFTLKHTHQNVVVDQLPEINDIPTIADFDLTQTGQKK